MESYKKAVEVLASTKSDYIFKNSSPEHASIVLATMIKCSEKEFRIYDDNLSGDIADLNSDFYSNLNSFINSGKTIKIVVDVIKSIESKIYTTLIDFKKQFPDKVFISIASESFKQKIASIFNKPINFALGDNSSFRIENVSDNESDAKRQAFCCFNNLETSNKLLSAFDSEFHTCQAI